MKRRDSKIAIVTGGNSGIGLATAQRFVTEAAYLYITGRRHFPRPPRQPDEMAKAVVFLASDDASDVNGVELFVDGGRTQV